MRGVVITVLEQLRKPFPASQVRKNQDGLDYVSIDLYIRRLLEVLGLDYDFVVEDSRVELLPADMTTKSGKRLYLAQARGALKIRQPSLESLAFSTTVRYGVGADVAFDADKAIKTAQAEALKKAAHQFGIALELWDEDHRAGLARQRRLAGGSEAALKQEVWRVAKEKLGEDKPTAAQVAKAFGAKTGELADRETLLRILTDEGVL